MKTTLHLPDELYRQVKARAALEGRTVRGITIELYQRWLREIPSPREDDPKAWLRDWLQAADDATKATPPGPSAREILEQDRVRLEPKR